MKVILISNTASLYGETKRFSDSERMFHKALKLNPTYVEAYFNLGKEDKPSVTIYNYESSIDSLFF